jgi:hypothetical protein
LLVVYLRTGERRKLPRAVSTAIVGDRLLCLAKNGRTVAFFPAHEVYLCSKAAIPTIPA